MAPAAKFYALVTSVTIAVMFVVLTWIVPTVKSLGTLSAIASGMAAVLASVGIYKLVSQVATAFIHRSAWARRWIFGGAYLHGTWVGVFFGRAGDKRFIIEHIDQDLDGVVISGQSYTDTLQPHADWTSVAVSVDARTGKLIFSYTLTIYTRPGTIVGINSSQLERPSHRGAATAIAGHAQDLGDEGRVRLKEVKVSEKLLSWADALKQAQKKFS